MTRYTIRNPVPSADEMGESLGLTKERVTSVRVIMNSPSRSKRTSTKSRVGSGKRSGAKRVSSPKSGRR